MSLSLSLIYMWVYSSLQSHARQKQLCWGLACTFLRDGCALDLLAERLILDVDLIAVKSTAILSNFAQVEFAGQTSCWACIGFSLISLTGLYICSFIVIVLGCGMCKLGSQSGTEPELLPEPCGTGPCDRWGRKCEGRLADR